MKSLAYQDGYRKFGERIEKGHPPDIGLLQRAVKDCREMGWDKLQDYFRGGIAAMTREVGEEGNE